MASRQTEIVIPEIQTPETPKRFFTADEADYTTISNWLEGNDFVYGRFYASFLNHTIAVAARSTSSEKGKAKLSQKENALLWIFDDLPVQTQGMIDAMSAYGEDHWDHGVASGFIDLKDGKLASNVEIEQAEKRLAGLLYANEKQKDLLEENPQLARLFGNTAAVEKRKGKAQKQTEKKVTKGLGRLDLERGDKEE